MSQKRSEGIGPPPSATEWNRHVDTADLVLGRQALGTGGAVNTGGSNGNFVTVKNDSGADRTQGQILEFTGFALTDLTARQVFLLGGSPTLANGFGVLTATIKSGESDPFCQVSGACVAQVNVIDAAHKFAKVSSATYVLQSAVSGPARILYKPSGTGEKTCSVLLNGGEPFEFHRGVADEACAKGETETVSRYTEGTTSDSGTNDEVFGELGEWDTGDIVYYVKSGAILYAIAKECPEA